MPAGRPRLRAVGARQPTRRGRPHQRADWAAAAAGRQPDPRRVCPAWSTCTRTYASPATRTRRRSRSGLAAAAHGGFTTVCAMANTEPPLDRAAALREVVARLATPPRRRSGSWPTARSPRAAPARAWRRSGSSRMRVPSASVTMARRWTSRPSSARPGLRGGVGRPLVEHPELRCAHPGRRGPRGPGGHDPRSEGLAERRRDRRRRPRPGTPRGGGAPGAPGAAPRLHLTHLSTAEALALIRPPRRMACP